MVVALRNLECFARLRHSGEHLLSAASAVRNRHSTPSNEPSRGLATPTRRIARLLKAGNFNDASKYPQVSVQLPHHQTHTLAGHKRCMLMPLNLNADFRGGVRIGKSATYFSRPIPTTLALANDSVPAYSVK